MSIVVQLFPTPLPQELVGLQTLCRRWLGFVIRVQETPRRQRLDFLRKSSSEYMALHDHLLDECAAQTEHASGSQREFLEHVAAVIAPWPTLESLSYQPASILGDLIAQATHIERTLHCPRRAPRWIPRFALITFVVAIAVLTVPHLWLRLFPNAGSPLGLPREFSRSVTLFVERASDIDRTVALTAVILVAGITALHSSRQY